MVNSCHLKATDSFVFKLFGHVQVFKLFGHVKLQCSAFSNYVSVFLYVGQHFTSHIFS